MATITIDEKSVIRTIAGYLRDKGCFEALNSLLVESSVAIFDDLPEEFMIVQRMILQGRWKDAISCIAPLYDSQSKVGKEINLLIGKQQYLESLSWQGGGSDRWVFPPWRPNEDTVNRNGDDSVELNAVIALLNTLKPLCSIQEFNSLCLFLTLERLEDHPEYPNWSVAEGRYHVCSTLLQLLLDIFQQRSASSVQTHSGLLMKLLSVAVETTVDDPNHSHLFRAEHVHGGRAIHLQSLDQELRPLLDSQKLRLTPRNQIKAQKRFPVTNTTSSATAVQSAYLATNLSRVEREDETNEEKGDSVVDLSLTLRRSPSSKSNSSVQTNNRKGDDGRLEFTSTLAWPSAQQQGASALEEEDWTTDYKEDSQVRSTNLQSISNNNSRVSTASSQPGTRSNGSNRPSAMSWTVDLGDGDAAPAKEATKPRSLSSGRGGSRLSTGATSAPNGGSEQKTPPKLRPTTSNDPMMRNDGVNHSNINTSALTLDAMSPIRTSLQDKSSVLGNVRSPGLSSPYTAAQSQAIALTQRTNLHQGNNNSSLLTTSTNSPLRQSLNSGSASTSKLQQQPVHRAKPVLQRITKGVLYDDSVPLRCVSVLEDREGPVTIAVGTNARSVHLLQFDPRDLDRLSEETDVAHSSAGGDIDPESIVQDLTPHVHQIHTFDKVHNGSVYAMDYHSESQVLLTASNDKSLRVLRPWSREIGSALKGHTGTIRVVKFAPQEVRGSADVFAVSAGAGDYRARMWDLQTESCVRIFTEHTATVHALTWLDPSTFVTGCEAGSLILHDTRSKSALFSLDLGSVLRAQGHSDTITRSICALEHCLELETYQQQEHAIIQRMPGAFLSPTFGHVLAVGCLAGSLSFLQILQQSSGGKYEPQVLADLPKAHSSDVRTLLSLPLRAPDASVLSSSFDAHDREGKVINTHTTEAALSTLHAPLFFSASYDATAALWTCQPPRRRIDPLLACSVTARMGAAHKDKVLSAAALHSGRSIVTTGADGRVVLWNLPTSSS